MEGGVVEMTDGERALDPVTRAASALGRVARPGLSKAWSVSSPNMAQLGAHTGTRDTSHVTIVTCHTLYVTRLLQIQTLWTYWRGSATWRSR